MARKSNFSFGSVPTIRARRTQFDLSHGVKTSMNVGTLYPTYIQEVVPGDTFKVDSSFVTRVSSSFLKPVMDNVYQDTYFFFVPNRLVFNDWEKFFGSAEPDDWTEPETVRVPSVGGTVSPGTVGDYLGLPVNATFDNDNSAEGYLSDLPFRAFAKIYNDWFRDENLIDSVYIPKADNVSSNMNNDPWGPNNYHGKLPKVSKYHDYFTSCLPGTQKGPAVTVGGKSVPVMSDISTHDMGNPIQAGYKYANGSRYLFAPGANMNATVRNPASGSSDSANLGLHPVSQNEGVSPVYMTDSSLVADVPPISVSDLRISFQLQKYLEKNARGGTRYTEFILSHFGVQSPDARLQRSEFLGGSRQPLSIQQVASTNGSNVNGNTASLADLGAYSLSNGRASFNKGFVEHGFIIGVTCLRYKHTYQQGVERFWIRNDFADFYDPLFANISEQPVYRSEIFVPTGSTSIDLKDNVFGYNEAFADMRYRPNRVTGQMRSAVSNNFDIWHFADEYSNAPILSKDFIEETPNFVDRTLAVPSDTADQFIVDIFHKVKAIREMPLYSIPGLVDHH